MTDPTRDPTGPDVAHDNTRRNADPTAPERDQTPDPTRDQTDADALPIPAAAERLGLTSDAVRMRLKRGTLDGRKVNGRWVVFVPRLDTDQTPTERTSNAQAPPTERLTQHATEHPNATRELIATLQAENARLWELLNVEVEARRRADHLVAGLMERLPELPAETPERETRDAAEPLGVIVTPTPDTERIPSWRRWWQRMTGAG
jgi:hypothetical protein